MPTRPFYVQRNGDCILLEGAWRVTEIDVGTGSCSATTRSCPVDRAAARSMLEELEERSDVDALANEAIEALDRLPDSWETESLGELEI